MIRIGLSTIFLSATIFASECRSSDITTFSNGIAKLESKYGNSTLIIEVRTQKFSNFPYRETLMWGGYLVEPHNSHPKMFVASFTIEAGKKDIVLPLSAFADLADPYTISIEKKSKNGFDIKLLGSETSEAYEALFHFEGDHLKLRKVKNLEFPDEAWEETVYSWVADNGR